MTAKLRVFASTIAIVIVVAGSVASALGAPQQTRIAAAAALLLYVAIEVRLVLRGGRIMLAACAAATAAALAFLPSPAAVCGKGLAEAAFIIGLFVSLSALRDAAETSPLVQRCGDRMVRQPPGRRFLVLSVGSHLISLVLNFGVLSLLGTMVIRGNTLEAAGGDVRVAAVRKQRMMTAMMRGFAMMTVWSPLSVSFAVTQAAVPGLQWSKLLPLQLVLAVILMALGWVMDRRAFPPAARPRGEATPTDWWPLAMLTLLIVGVVAAAIAAAEILQARLVIGAMIAVPPAALIWLTAQHWGTGPAHAPLAALWRFSARLTVSLPAFRNEVAMLGGAMYFGTVLSAFISPAMVARAVALLPLPPVMVTVLLAWSMMALARYGISQIVTATLLGGALGSLAHQGIQPLVLASGLMGAWSLSACTTSVGAAVLTVSRLAEVPIATVAREWNGKFVIVGAFVLALWMMGLSLVV